MSESDSASEKTEEATSRRLEKAREEGQIPRSRELVTALVLIGSTLALWIFGGRMAIYFMNLFRRHLIIEREKMYDPEAMIAALASSFYDAFWMILPFFAVVLMLALIAPTLLGGFLFSGKSIMPKWERLDPIAGLKRMFSVKSLIELVKSIAKVGVVIGATYLMFGMYQHELLSLGQQPLEQALSQSIHILLWALLIIGGSTLLIAAVDVPYQMWEYAKKLRMSLQEIKDEMKDVEGKPEVKGRIRQLQREMANRRMMSQVPKADVIITNPTHFSVALRYDPETMATPVVLAKGVEQTALKIREIAKEHKIEQVRTPVLARAIYYTTDIDSEIPRGLYLAVAQVLAYVFQLRLYRKGRGERPAFPTQLPVPKEMIFPEAH